MYAVIGIVAFVALLIMGRRLTLRRYATGTKFADRMAGAGLRLVAGGGATYVAERGGHVVTVRVMHQGVLATISASTTADLTAHRFAQRYALEDSVLQPESAPRDAATAAVDVVVLENAKPFSDAVGLAVGPGIVNVMVFGLTDAALSRATLRVVPAAEQLLDRVVAAYRTHEHLPVITRAEAVIGFGGALAVPGLTLVTPDDARNTSETGTVTERWEQLVGRDRLRVEFMPEFDQASLAWMDSGVDLVDLDSDKAITFSRARAGDSLALQFRVHEDEESTVSEAVQQFADHLQGVTRLDVFARGISLTVTAPDPVALAQRVNGLVDVSRELHTNLAALG